MPTGIITGMDNIRQPKDDPEPTALTRAIVDRLNIAYDEKKSRGGLGQVRLGKLLGVSQGQVSRILNGKKPLYIEHIDAMCTALGLDLTEVLDTAKRTVREQPVSPAPAEPAEPVRRRRSTGTTARRPHAHSRSDAPGATGTTRSHKK